MIILGNLSVFYHNRMMEGETNMFIKNSQDLIDLINRVLDKDEAITIETRKGKAVIVSEEKYNSMIETIYLVSQPGLVESIKQAEKEDINQMKVYNSKEPW